jgi:hypothetical protein
MTNSNLVDFNGQVSWLGTLNDLTCVEADLMKHVVGWGSIAHQPTGCDVFTSIISCWNPLARRQGGKWDTSAAEESVAIDKKRSRPERRPPLGPCPCIISAELASRYQ